MLVCVKRADAVSFFSNFIVHVHNQGLLGNPVLFNRIMGELFDILFPIYALADSAGTL